MKIYTMNEAANIIDLFEDLLDKYDITVPSEDDADRTEDNAARIYGTEYSELLDTIQTRLAMLTALVKNGAEVVTDRWED